MLFLEVFQQFPLRCRRRFGPRVAVEVLTNLDLVLHSVGDEPEFVHFGADEVAAVPHRKKETKHRMEVGTGDHLDKLFLI